MCASHSLSIKNTRLSVLFTIFMDRISRHSLIIEGVRVGGLRILSLLFANDMALLALTLTFSLH